MTQLVLSLFPGIGLLDRAFEEEGFVVVRGPDVLWGGDIRSFHPPAGKFDGVIGGPPCQMFSSLAHMVRQNGYEPKFGNLIPEFERCVNEAQPQWFLMEEVPQAPLPAASGYGVHGFVLNNRQLGAAQNRKRRISFGWQGGRRVLGIEIVALESIDFEYAATGGSHGPGGIARESDGHGNPETQARRIARKRGIPVLLGGSGKIKSSVRERGGGKGRMPWNAESKSAVEELLRKQGLPIDAFKHCPFTMAGLCSAIGNGVPLPMGRAIAKAVKEATAAQNAAP